MDTKSLVILILIFCFVSMLILNVVLFMFYSINQSKIERLENLIKNTDEKLFKEYFAIKFYKDVKEVIGYENTQ